nr:trigger factor [Demequina sp. TTPB684]
MPGSTIDPHTPGPPSTHQEKFVTSALEKIDSTTVKITVTLSEEDIAPAMEHAYEHIGREVTIPGFRKGKVPAKILEQRVGKGAVIEHAVNDGVPGWYAEAIEEQAVRPYGQPEIEVTKLPGIVEGDEGIEFIATVEVRPDITLPAPADLVIEVAPIEVSDEDVEERMTALRERFGTLVAVDRAADAGDFVTLDLNAEINGEAVDAVQGTSYQVGTGTMIEGLDDAVTGLSAGESATFEGPLAAGDFAGEPATISVTVTAVKTRELPKADDDFAQLASEFDTVDELKADLREQAARIKTNNQAMEAREKLLQVLTEKVGEFDLPSKIIESEVHNHLENENRLEDEEHRAEVTDRAKEALRTQMLLDKVAEDLEIDVQENELVDYLVNASRQYGTDPGTFIQQVQQSGQIPAIVADVARSKATAYALRRATVQDTDGNPVDLKAIIGGLEDETAPQADAAEDSTEK